MQLIAANADTCPDGLADLIWSEDPALMTLEFQSPEIWAKTLATEWPTTGAINSHDATTLAVQNGQVVGVINAFSVSEMDARLRKSDSLRPPSLVADDIAEQIDQLFAAPSDTAFYVMDIAVHPSAQNSGLGAKLMDHATQQAQRAGAASVCLDVNVANPAVGFYQHLGFKVVQRCDVPTLSKYGVSAHFHMAREINH